MRHVFERKPGQHVLLIGARFADFDVVALVGTMLRAVLVLLIDRVRLEVGPWFAVLKRVAHDVAILWVAGTLGGARGCLRLRDLVVRTGHVD